MADRVNIKVDEVVRDQLKEYKRPRESWSHFLIRAAEALEARRDREHIFEGGDEDSMPTCLGCGDPTETWQVQISGVLCTGCTDLDVAVECG
jgi:hypothetical protein